MILGWLYSDPEFLARVSLITVSRKPERADPEAAEGAIKADKPEGEEEPATAEGGVDNSEISVRGRVP